MKLRTKILTGAAAAMAMVVGAVVMLTDSSIQAQVNAANCGDVITLEAGRIYVENITLPVKPCTDTSYITIQSSRASELPEGKRVTPAQAPLLAWLQSNVNAEPVIKTAPGAHHYRFIGIRASTVNEGVFVYDLVRLGEGKPNQTALAQAPHHISIDRSYLHGWPTQDVLRGVAANAAHWEVTNSYISDIHWIGAEAQAIGSWNGPGPSKIINSYLEAAGENVMFGGADSGSAELMPAGLEMRLNHLFKPLSWKVGHPTYAGKHWTVKNIAEWKAMAGAVIEANVFENNWTDAQDGSGILFTVRNQECTAPWSTVTRVTFKNNIVKGVSGAALNLLGIDNEATPEYRAANPGKCSNIPADQLKLGSTRGTGVTVENNLFIDIGGAFVQLNGFYNVTVNRNTSLQRGNLMTLYGEPSNGFKFTSNLTIDHDYGIFGDGGTGGVAALNKYTPGWAMTGNVIAKPYGGGGNYPPNNQYPSDLILSPDFRSTWTETGCNIDQLLAAQSGVVVPLPSPSPTVSPSISPSPTATQPLPSPTPPPPSPSPSISPRPSPSPSASPTPAPCVATAWPNSVSGQNSKMQERRAQGCYPVRRTNNGMEYARP